MFEASRNRPFRMYIDVCHNNNDSLGCWPVDPGTLGNQAAFVELLDAGRTEIPEDGSQTRSAAPSLQNIKAIVSGPVTMQQSQTRPH